MLWARQYWGDCNWRAWTRRSFDGAAHAFLKEGVQHSGAAHGRAFAMLQERASLATVMHVQQRLRYPLTRVAEIRYQTLRAMTSTEVGAQFTRDVWRTSSMFLFLRDPREIPDNARICTGSVTKSAAACVPQVERPTIPNTGAPFFEFRIRKTRA